MVTVCTISELLREKQQEDREKYIFMKLEVKCYFKRKLILILSKFWDIFIFFTNKKDFTFKKDFTISRLRLKGLWRNRISSIWHCLVLNTWYPTVKLHIYSLGIFHLIFLTILFSISQAAYSHVFLSQKFSY